MRFVSLLFVFLICTTNNMEANYFRHYSISSISILQDSTKIEKKPSKIKTFFNKILFRKKPKTKTPTPSQKPENAPVLKNYQGKIIRNIYIESHDPFGYSLTNDAQLPTKRVEKWGNKLHLKTKPFTIKSLLLFKKNTPLDSLKINETERLIRAQGYMRRVRIEPVENGLTDSVDLRVKVLDAWSIFANGALSTSNGRIKLSTRNFAGLGHFVSFQYRRHFDWGKNAYRAQYFIPNIAQTYISANAYYDIDLGGNYVKTLGLNRNFYSSLTKYTGGVTYNQTYYRDSVPNLVNNTFEISAFKYEYYNAWFGRSFKLYERTKKYPIITNLITSARIYYQNYSQQPNTNYDPLGYYSDNTMVLGMVGLSSFNFVKDRYIFYDNLIEDIPVGKIISLTGGLQWKNNLNRPYIGANISHGQYYDVGYFGGSLQFGTFFQHQKMSESVVRLEGMYFSKVFQLGNWRFRQFINPELVWGFNRLDYDKDRITLNGRFGIDGFDSYHLTGTKKFLLTFQTQSYAPKPIYGFRFNPFFNASLGAIGDNAKFEFNKTLYARIGFGVQINNDYFVFNRFQLSVSFFPLIPNQGSNIFKFNTLRNNHLELQQFIVGQPNTVLYQ